MSKQSIYLKLERQIASDERGGITHRWEYGRELLKAKEGRRQLPDGMIADLIKAAGRAGKKLTETEIQRRIRLATVYTTDQQVRQVLTDLGSWSEIIAKGFPAIEVDDPFTEPDDLEAPLPDEYEQLSLLPGFRKVIKLHDREIPLRDATVPDVIAYRDKYREMHENFGKTLALIEATVDAILDGWDGDEQTKAVDAYQRATADP